VKILLSGHEGFIGCRALSAYRGRGHAVHGMDKKSKRSTADYLQLTETVRRFRPDVIVHCGASCSTRISLENPLIDFVDNAVGTVNVAEAARIAGGVPILYVSTVKVAPGADGLVAPLGLSKRIGEDYLAAFHQLYGLPAVVLQPSTVYGPGQVGDRNLGWVSHFIRCAAHGIQPTVYGAGTQSRDILYVDDFVSLMVDITENFDDYQGGVYPVGGGPENEVSILGLLHHLGVTQYKREPAIPTDLDRVVTDNSAATGVRGWRPTTPWHVGVHKTREAL
jgi:nucleoside-diphosphate-sugar epimerase